MLKLPCKGVPRRDCYFSEDEYVAHNKGSEDELRASYRRHVALGNIPPVCPKCGLVHAKTRSNASA